MLIKLLNMQLYMAAEYCQSYTLVTWRILDKKKVPILWVKLVQYGWDASRKAFFIGRLGADLYVDAALTILAGAKTIKFKRMML